MTKLNSTIKQVMNFGDKVNWKRVFSSKLKNVNEIISYRNLKEILLNCQTRFAPSSIFDNIPYARQSTRTEKKQE